MADTPNLGIAEMTEAQASKYVTFNEFGRDMDTWVHLAVIDKDDTAPPSGPADGDRYIVAAGASGDWTGHEDDIATYENTAWVFRTPVVGIMAYALDEGQYYIYLESAGWTAGSAVGFGASVFTALNDAPSDYSGFAGYYIRVNDTEDGLEFVKAPYDLAGYRNGKPESSEEVFRHVFTRAVDYADDMASSLASAGVAANAEAVFVIKKDGTQFATMTFAISGTTATFATDSAAESFAASEVLSVEAPASQDSALANIAFTLYGTRG
jgi:hypothetical protein